MIIDEQLRATLARTKAQPGIGPKSYVEVEGRRMSWRRFIRQYGIPTVGEGVNRRVKKRR